MAQYGKPSNKIKNVRKKLEKQSLPFIVSIIPWFDHSNLKKELSLKNN